MDCPSGKIKYKSIAEAYFFLGKTLKRRGQKRLCLQCYFCPDCQGYHAGNAFPVKTDVGQAMWKRWWRRKKRG